jgi:hypothetical protein
LLQYFGKLVETDLGFVNFAVEEHRC